MIQRIHDSGEVAKTYRYDAFGNEETPEPLDANPFRYCGEYFDAETATLYLRARSYDPRSGRFTQEDELAVSNMNLFNPTEDCSEAELIGGVDKGERKADQERRFEEFPSDMRLSGLRNINLGQKTFTPIWIIADTLTYNRYVYGKSNPNFYTDPTGKSADPSSWAATMWWLVLVDGGFPVGDMIYIIGLIVTGVVVLVEGIYLAAEHVKRRGSKSKTNDKHTKPRPGRESERKKQEKGWKENPNKRPK